MEILEITETEARALIKSNEDGHLEPLGLFWYKDNICGHFIAIDNSTGDAYIEEFCTLDDCLKYLHGESCTAVSGFTY
jgi:hypothetical protein